MQGGYDRRVGYALPVMIGERGQIGGDDHRAGCTPIMLGYLVGHLNGGSLYDRDVLRVGNAELGSHCVLHRGGDTADEVQMAVQAGVLIQIGLPVIQHVVHGLVGDVVGEQQGSVHVIVIVENGHGHRGQIIILGIASALIQMNDVHPGQKNGRVQIAAGLNAGKGQAENQGQAHDRDDFSKQILAHQYYLLGKKR